MTEYVPPKVWTWDQPSGGQFASINRPIAGPTHDKELPVGKHPFQLYSLGTPNGQKVSIMFEELLEHGHTDADYDAWLINIGEGDQFGSGFVGVNPELEDPGAGRPKRSRADPRLRIRRDPRPSCREVWRTSLPAFGPGACGDLVVAVLADGQRALPRWRLRPLLLLRTRKARISDQSLRDGDQAAARRTRPPPGGERFRRGRDYSIADIAIWPWYGQLALDRSYKDAGEFSSRLVIIATSSAGPARSMPGQP